MGSKEKYNIHAKDGFKTESVLGVLLLSFSHLFNFLFLVSCFLFKHSLCLFEYWYVCDYILITTFFLLFFFFCGLLMELNFLENIFTYWKSKPVLKFRNRSHCIFFCLQRAYKDNLPILKWIMVSCFYKILLHDIVPHTC